MLPTWMRRALLLTAVMNIVVAGMFLPATGGVRQLAGMPPAESAVYLLTVALFVFLFGCGYLYCGITGRPERLFLAIAAAGKVSFVMILAGCWAAGTLTLQALLTSSPDLVFGLLFAYWLFFGEEAGAGTVAHAPQQRRARA